MVARFLLFRQWMQLGFLGRDLAVGMQLTQPQITAIRQAANMLGEETSAFFEQFKIMLASFGKSRRNNRLCLLVYNQLRFLGVPLLFAAVVLSLLFFGRSMGCSVASISTTSITLSLACSAFLPGRRNSPDFISTFSTRRIVRHTVASLTS
ncbi:MAG: hypothetical protein P4L50_23605 [Anaerolineaceae bacterium]|nr:hypothetical protein [Anaerolineaceae bacterium]